MQLEQARKIKRQCPLQTVHVAEARSLGSVELRVISDVKKAMEIKPPPEKRRGRPPKDSTDANPSKKAKVARA